MKKSNLLLAAAIASFLGTASLTATADETPKPAGMTMAAGQAKPNKFWWPCIFPRKRCFKYWVNYDLGCTTRRTTLCNIIHTK